MTRDAWHLTCDTWHVTCWGWGWTFSKIFSSFSLTVCDLWYMKIWRKRLTHSLSHSLNDEAVYRTHKLKLWHNSITQIVSKIKKSKRDKTQNGTKHNISYYDKTWKLKLWLHSNCGKIKYLNYDKVEALVLINLKKSVVVFLLE